MASFNPRVFTNPDGLKKISNVHLVALLDKWRNYFAGRNVEIPSDAQTAFPHDDLAAALMTYDEEMPLALMNGLYYIDEAASNETLDDLLDRAREASISIESNGDLTPADVAVQIWLANPDLLEERHMKAMVFKKTAFLQFPGRSGNEPDTSRHFRSATCRDGNGHGPMVREQATWPRNTDVCFSAPGRKQGLAIGAARHANDPRRQT